jgi:hypothetical protein
MDAEKSVGRINGRALGSGRAVSIIASPTRPRRGSRRTFTLLARWNRGAGALHVFSLVSGLVSPMSQFLRGAARLAVEMGAERLLAMAVKGGTVPLYFGLVSQSTHALVLLFEFAGFHSLGRSRCGNRRCGGCSRTRGGGARRGRRCSGGRRFVSYRLREHQHAENGDRGMSETHMNLCHIRAPPVNALQWH